MKHEIEAEVLGEIENGYRLKVSFTSLGMYIFGFRATPSKISGEWWVQPPATRSSAGWKQNPEFNKKETFWLEIEKACSLAISAYRGSEGNLETIEDDMFSESEMDRAFCITPVKKVLYSPTSEVS